MIKKLKNARRNTQDDATRVNDSILNERVPNFFFLSLLCCEEDTFNLKGTKR